MSESAWPEHELEYLGCCPVCVSPIRALEYGGIEDRVSDVPGFWDYYRCHGCGILYLDPRPTRESVGRLYENYFTHSAIEGRERKGWSDKFALGIRNDYLNWKYGYNNHPQQPGGRWFMYLLPPWLRLEWDNYARNLPKPLPENNRLLDVGCGNGDFLAAACSAGWEGWGIDFDPKAVEASRKRGLKTAFGSLLEQQYEDKAFDVITLSHVIEHVHDPLEVLKECARILKPSGMLWIATPNTDSFIQKWFKINWFDLSPQHLILFNSRALCKILQSIGFLVNFERRGAHIQSHWRASQAIHDGETGMRSVYQTPFLGKKMEIRYWPIEILAYILPSSQGDVVIRAIKH